MCSDLNGKVQNGRDDVDVVRREGLLKEERMTNLFCAKDTKNFEIFLLSALLTYTCLCYSCFVLRTVTNATFLHMRCTSKSWKSRDESCCVRAYPRECATPNSHRGWVQIVQFRGVRPKREHKNSLSPLTRELRRRLKTRARKVSEYPEYRQS